MTDPVDPPNPDLDTVRRDDLGEYDPMYPTLADVLDEWNLRLHGVSSGHHGIGLFLDLLAAEGYRVTPNPVPDVHLPPPTE